MELRTRNVANGDSRLKQVQQELSRRLLELEGAVFPEMYEIATDSSVSQSNKVAKLSEEVRYGLKEMESLIPSERDPAKRELYRKRLEASIQKLHELENQGKIRGSRWARQARERELLLGSNAVTYDPEAASEISAAVVQNKSLKQSSRGVDEVMTMGRAVLDSLGSQKESLKRATDKVESIAGSLGLSNSLLRAVRRRQWGDAMIVYGGMVSVTVILFVFYRWLHN